jgi:hypothetical protein
MTISNVKNMTDKGEHSSAHFVHGKEVKFQSWIKFSEGTEMDLMYAFTSKSYLEVILSVILYVTKS